MLIDWFTTIAQIINFLILVYLLKRFLYGPIIRAMDRREQKIADRLNQAEQTRQEAEQEQQQYQQKSKQLEQEKKAILDESKQQAYDERQEMQRQIREEKEEARRMWRRELARQQQTFLDELSRRASEQIMQTAGRALQDLADQDLQARMTKVFINKLKELDNQAIEKLRRSMGHEHPSVNITGAFEIDSSARQQLTRTVRDVLGKSVSVEYDRDEDLLAGLKLNSSNEVVAWNLEEYFTGLQEEIAGFIARESGQEEEKGKLEVER